MSEVETEVEAPDIAPALLPADEDFDLFEIDEEEPAAVVPVVIDDLDEDELRARLAKAEKRAEFEREQRVKSSRKTWAQEAAEHFPYSQPEQIQADSRRSFLEQAKVQDQAFRTQAAPLLEKLEADREKIRDEERQAARAEVSAGWGRATTGTPVGPVDGEQTEQRLADARQKRSLVGSVKAMMDGRVI